MTVTALDQSTVDAARYGSGTVWLDPGTYELHERLVVTDVHVRAREAGVFIVPAADFVGDKLLAGGATSVRATLLDGIVVDVRDSGAMAVHGNRTAVVWRGGTVRGPVVLRENSACVADGASFQAPGGVAVLLDDAYLDASGCRFLGSVHGVGRLGGASAGLQLQRCVLERPAAWACIDVRAEDISGFRASVSASRMEGGCIRVGPYGIAQLSQVRHVGATTAVVEDVTGFLSAIQCLSSGAVVVTPDPARTALVACYAEGSMRNGLAAWSTRASDAPFEEAP